MHTDLLLIRNIFFCKFRKIKVWLADGELKFYHPESYPAVLKSTIQTLNSVINTCGSTCEFLTPWLTTDFHRNVLCLFCCGGVWWHQHFHGNNTQSFCSMTTHFTTEEAKLISLSSAKICSLFLLLSRSVKVKKPFPHAACNITENLALISSCFCPSSSNHKCTTRSKENPSSFCKTVPDCILKYPF